MTDFISYFLMIAGLVIGLGSVTVIDLHGFLARKSEYWTLATTRTHKVTKPLIWIGMTLFVIGFLPLYTGKLLTIQLVLSTVMILNGVFLSFKVSPFLLRREKRGSEEHILSARWQRMIASSFVISFLSWWASLFLLVQFLVVNGV